MYGTCNCYSCTAIVCNEFSTIYALLRCDTAVWSKALQGTGKYESVRNSAERYLDSALYGVLNTKT